MPLSEQPPQEQKLRESKNCLQWIQKIVIFDEIAPFILLHTNNAQCPMNSLIQDAALSLKMGIEDYQSSKPERALSAIKNITAGVQLLFKEKLRGLSPDGSDEVPLKEKTLGISVDWKRVDKIVQLRNDIEHYYSEESDARMRELIADTFLVIRDFLALHLSLEPTKVLDEETWAAIITVQEVYQKELSECRAETAKVEWPRDELRSVSEYLRCSNCHSELLKPQTIGEVDIEELTFKCTSCGASNEFKEIIEAGVKKYLGYEAYIAAKEGVEAPYRECQSCFLDTYLIEADFCASCLYECEYKECSCGNVISIEEQDLGGSCSYCNHRWNKMERE